MNISPIVFKSQASRALKGNWQTALLVSFFAEVPLVLLQLLQNTQLGDITMLTDPNAVLAAVQAIPQQTWTLLGVVSTISLVLTPVLAVGCNNYFINRLRKQELGFMGLLSRWKITGKALLLYVVMTVKIFLWSLLLVVPGYVALLRYSMAPYFLAEEPEIGVMEAINRSKQAMQKQKMNFFILQISFIGWYVASLIVDVVFSGFSVILALVLSQFVQLFMTAYMNAASASFYLAVSQPQGMWKAQKEAEIWFKRFSGMMNGRRSMNADEPPQDGEREPQDEPEKPDGTL